MSGAVDLRALAAALAADPQSARALARAVVAELARALGQNDATYSTKKGLEPPEFVGRRRAWLKLAPSIPGSTKIGRWTTVSRAAFDAWKAGQGGPPLAKVPAANDAHGSAWTPARALDELALRRSR